MKNVATWGRTIAACGGKNFNGYSNNGGGFGSAFVNVINNYYTYSKSSSLRNTKHKDSQTTGALPGNDWDNEIYSGGLIFDKVYTGSYTSRFTAGGGNMADYLGLKPGTPDLGYISVPNKTTGDKIQGIPVIGRLLNDIYVPVTRATRMFGQPIFGDWYGETQINGESANSDDAVLGLGKTALTFLTAGAAANKINNTGNLFNFANKNFRFAFETVARSPTIKGAADGVIRAWHFNIKLPFTNNYHIYINPFKWKYYYKWTPNFLK